MALIAFCSAKGSPGTTVTALACTLAWTRRVILAECDPAGGDIAAGYLCEMPLENRGLSALTASLRRRQLQEDLWAQFVDLSPGDGSGMQRLLLPGLTDPAQAARWTEVRRPGDPPGWDQLAQLFTDMGSTSGYDVLADCGRLSAADAPAAVLAAADAILIVLRPTLPSMRASALAVASLRAAGRDPLGLITIGDRPYSSREVATNLDATVVAALPEDAGTAAVLSRGGEYHRSRLLRAAARAERAVWQLVTAATDTRPLDPREVLNAR